ncbi:MAG: Holliday junction branch migration DNA helicase RuvB [Candidatus Gracilibacteria bacterium]|jgi:Holliday junction DNA helicase RuvB
MIKRDAENKPKKTSTPISPFSENDPTVAKLEVTLRPKKLSEYIGQMEAKKNLIVFIEATKKRKEPLEHILIHSPAGLGKTTLANIIANEIGVNIKTTSGPVLEKQGDLAALLTNLQEGDVLFIDEIHRLRPAVEEILYSAMEDFALDLMLGKGPSAKTMRLTLPKFTLIGATTKISMLSSPLRDRFGHNFKLNFYTADEIKQIILRSAKILGCKVNDDAAEKLAKCSRQTPRIANRLLRRIRDFADYEGKTEVTYSLVETSLMALGVDALGLDETDRNLIRVVIEKFRGGPVGLNTLSAATSEEEATIEEVYEPFLMQLGFLERTPRGRIATENAYNHLGIKCLRTNENQTLSL